MPYDDIEYKPGDLEFKPGDLVKTMRVFSQDFDYGLIDAASCAASAQLAYYRLLERRGTDPSADADGFEINIGKNGIYSVFWNVAEDEPIANAKILNVIVQWRVKDDIRQIDFNVIRLREL